MYKLFISTFDSLITIALLKDNKVISIKEKKSSRNHSTLTMPMIDSILKENSINVHDLKEIIVVNGPGSFTGVRIGVTIAKTLAYTLNIPIKTITSLEAFAVSTKSIDNKLIIIPDLKGNYVGYFDKNNKLINELTYMDKDNYNEFIKDKEQYIIKSSKLNVELISNYLNNVESINPHSVNPIYIKNIEALNGK